MANPTTNYSLITNPDDPEAEIGHKNSLLNDPTNRPDFNRTLSETVYEGQHNTWIVLGRDRPGGWNSGYGGLGHLKAGAIDIVAGRLSALDSRTNSGPVNPSTAADAARIYLSQKTDIDVNYSIPDGVTGKSSALSGIAIKADAVRVIARDSLKLVTNTDSKLSNGTEAYSAYGVQLIAANEKSPEMQPIPKGDNLVQAFDILVENVKELNGIVMTFLKLQQKFNKKISDHAHFENYWGQKTSFDPKVFHKHLEVLQAQYFLVDQSLKFNTNNFESWKGTYIKAVGSRYINSFYHYLN
jgi:hypothetical protein